jgi:predicted membrane-bound mannosyltransferase
MLAGVALLACAIRLIHASALSNAPVFAVLLGDSKRYVEWGAEIARGDWLGTQAFYQAPLYPYALAILFKAFGVSAEIVRVAQAFVGAAACVLVVMAARLFFDWRAGLVAGLALALYPPAIFFDGHIQKASLDLLFMAALLVAVGGYQHERRNRWLVLLGISLGCLILDRENARCCSRSLPCGS